MIVDFCQANVDSTEIVHLVHPRPVPWASLASVFASMLNVPLVPYSTWLSKLENLVDRKSGSEDVDIELLQKVHALRLLPFFKSLSVHKHDNLEAFAFPRLLVARAMSLSPLMANPDCPRLVDSDVQAWVGYWRRVSLIPGP